ncbi:hypothetical protein BO99DRAFT_432499 [Aspergillus violaceofuscus CBS 115571]|uniref:Uncharacterized protein n=1 Tax=Aspergillus violaceofuscus (strain CBS 115571) TaxID=1450538 RepID=A0A2V5H7Q0_ASPV1|nr:hypothetical protein BO99DRAFT_432499 [Aspergillus violaceofuscus CBS 115571]
MIEITSFDDAANQILENEWSDEISRLYRYQVEDVWHQAWRAEDARWSMLDGDDDNNREKATRAENTSHL